MRTNAAHGFVSKDFLGTFLGGGGGKFFNR